MPPADPFLARLRATAALTVLALIVFVVIAQVFGRLFLVGDFGVGDFIVASLVGALLALLGIESLVRLAK